MEDNNYDDAFFLYSRKRRQFRKFNLILRAYSLMGILTAIFAGGYFIFTLLPVKLSMEQQMSLMIAGIGIALALMSRVTIIIRKEREEEKKEILKEYEHISNFLNTWARFEVESKKALKNEGEDLNQHSLRSMISRLHEDGKIDKADVMVLEEALQARNSILHGGQIVSATYASKFSEILIEIIKKIATFSNI